MPYFSNSVKELKSSHTYLQLFAEFFGSLVLSSASAAASQEWKPKKDRMQIGLVVGIVYGVMMTVTQHISGGHLNSALTITHAVFGRMYFIKAILYVVAQCIGSVAGAAIVLSLHPDMEFQFGIHTMVVIAPWQGMIIEFVAGIIIVLIWETCMDPGKPDMYPVGPEIIGFTGSACLISIIPFTGGSINPSRSFGSAVVGGDFTDHWVFWIAPTLGMILGCFIYTFYKAPREPEFDKEIY